MKSRFFQLFLVLGMCTFTLLAQEEKNVANPLTNQSSNSTSQASAISNPQGTDAAFSQQIAPAFQGFWTLNVEKSDFGSRPIPKMGLVNWGEHGWTFALVTADGRLFADGVSTDRGCALIGLSPNYSCQV